MRVKFVKDEDFVNYRQPAMFVGTISCNGKCCTEAGIPLSVCQNDGWRSCAPIEIEDKDLCMRYFKNPITKSIVFGGLEPMEQIDELILFLDTLRDCFECSDDVVVYTGYRPEEIQHEINSLSLYKNVVVKFGRFVPNRPHIYDKVLGVELASDNQWAERIS